MLRRTQKIKNTLLFALYALVLGVFSGAIIWLILYIMNFCIDVIWQKIPDKISYGTNYYIYQTAVCTLGGLVIGVFQRKYGILPDTLEETMTKLKKEGTYSYDKLYIIAIAALLPLVFGGSLGPEAGLTGLVTGLCCWAGDKLKYKGEEAKDLARAGMAATLGVIFEAPLFGFINNYEKPREDEKKYFSPKEFKVAKAIVYAAGIAGGFGTMMLLKSFFGGGLGLARFTAEKNAGIGEWKWFIVFAAAGLLCGLLYLTFNKITKALGQRIKKHRISSCMTAGFLLAMLGIWLPWTMFSGEHEMGILMENWENIPVTLLMMTAIGKILAVNICVNFGWKGGNIFPVIFSGVSMGYALAAVSGVEPVFAVAVVSASAYGYIMRKPLTVVAVLFLCFPLRLIVPLTAAAYIASLIPAPWLKSNHK